MGVDASLNMVFDLLEAGIFLGGMSFQVGGVSSTTRLEGVADDDVAAVAVAAADVTVCGAWGVLTAGAVDMEEAEPVYFVIF